VGPVAGFGAARPGMYREEAPVPVHFPAHELKNILLFITGKKIFQPRLNFGTLRLVPFLSGKFVEGFKVFHFFQEIFPGLIAVLEALELSQYLLRPAAVVPELSFPGLGLKAGYAILKSGFFKDASRYC